MKRIYIAIAVAVLLAQAFFPATASAQSQQAPPQSSAGERMLRNALIGAGIGAALVGTVAIAASGDCGSCVFDNAKAILNGAMYGALIGAAIRVHPSRRPTPGRPSRIPTFSPHITKHVKAMNVVVRF